MALGPEQVLNELGGYAKVIYDNGVIDQEQRLTPTYDSLKTQTWNLRGTGWNFDAHLQRSSSFKFQNPTEALPQDTIEISKQATISTVEQTGQQSFTKDFLVRLIKGATSFGDFQTKVQDLIKGGKKNMNQSCYIGPTNLRATLTTSPTASTTFNVNNTQYIFIGMYIDIYTGGALTISNVQITNISGSTVTVSSPITATLGDNVYLHEENIGTTSGKGFNSIPYQCDDGTDYSVIFEGLSRTTYPVWRGNRIDFGGAPLTNDALQTLQNLLYTQGGNDFMGEDYVSYVHPDSIRRYLTIVLPQKRYIDASKYDSGMEKPNMLEWNSKPIIVDPDCGKRDWILYNRNYGGKVELVPFSVDSSLGGTSMKWKAGYIQGVVVTYFSGQIGTSKPNGNAIGRNFVALS